MNNEFLKRILSSLILIPLVIFIITEGKYFFYILIILIYFISCYEWYKMTKNKSYSTYGYFFFTISLFCFYQLRYDIENSFIPLLITISICILTDIGGYIFGKIFKGPKLTTYSPNKTYSGLIGSFVLAFLFVPFFMYYDFFDDSQLLNFIIFTFLISTFSQAGDIIVSYFKRASNIKDTGKIIPGHGGLLDRIDGMLFAIPVSYILLSFNYLKF